MDDKTLDTELLKSSAATGGVYIDDGDLADVAALLLSLDEAFRALERGLPAAVAPAATFCGWDDR